MCQKVYNFFLYFSIIVVLAIVFGLSFKLLTSSCCWCDDVYFYVQDGNFTFKNLFIPLQQNNWFSTSLTRFFSFYLPKFFNLHPSDFKNQYFAIIEAIIFLSFFSLWTSILYDKKKEYDAIKKISFLHVFVFLFSFLFFYMQVQYRTMIIFLYEGLFRMIIPVFLSIFFIKQLIVKIEKEEPSSMARNICLFLTLFLCLISNEMICFTLLIFLLLYFISSLIKKNFLSEKFLNIGLIITSCISLLIYKSAFLRKSDVESLNTDYFVNLIPMFSEFFELFVQKVIVEHFVFYIIILIELVLLFITRNKNKTNIKLDIDKIILFYISGVILFFFSLFLLGKTHYNGGYWIEHNELHTMFNFILYACILFLLKPLLCKLPKIKNFIAISFILLFLFYSKECFENYIITYNQMNYVKTESYKIEKILRSASLKNEIGYIDSKYLRDNRFFFFYSDDWDENIYLKENLLIINSLFTNYMNSFESKQNYKKGYIFASWDLYNTELGKNNLIFRSVELKKPIFTKLLDEEFILQSKKNIN